MRKKQTFVMDTAAANNTLQQILANSQKTNSATVPPSIAEIQAKYKKEVFTYRIHALVAFIGIILLLLMPFLFHKPAVDVTSSGSGELEVFQHHMEEDVFYLTLTGGSIDYDNISIIYPDGSDCPVLSVDPSSDTITFEFTDKELNLFIPDTEGNVLHLLLTPAPNN